MKYQSYFDHEALKRVENIIQNIFQKMAKKCPKIVQNLSKIIHEIVQKYHLTYCPKLSQEIVQKFLKCNEVQVDIYTSLELIGQTAHRQEHLT